MAAGFHPRTDPLHLAFEVSPGCFNLGGSLVPVAIRDQMTRACLVVERLRETGWIGPGRALAVIGGGAGGMTAALRAGAVHSTPATVVERSGGLFTLQRGCRTRRIDPTLFDWPA